jgi:hypothetical protein
MKISKVTAKDLIQNSKGRIFTTTYTKKDNSTRVMNCRIGVQKGVTGEGLKYNPNDYNLIPVYDMQSKGYRMINVDTLQSLVINKETYEVGS